MNPVVPTGRTGATDPQPESARETDRRTSSIHWVYPEPRITRLTLSDNTLGRSPDCDVVLDDTRVSRCHATLSPTQPGVWVLKDDGSSNGVNVDGQRVLSATVRDGSVVRLGDCVGVIVHSEQSHRPPDQIGDGESRYLGSGKVQDVVGYAERAATTGDPIFIHAETGTGKEYLARIIHRASGRSGAFVPVNCAGLRGSLASSGLFGYVRGAFTGADRAATGFVRAAARGTLFLDEVGELPPEAQALLLRTAQDGEVTPVGSTSSERVDVRLICATHVDLLASACNGGFRPDLYYRLTTHTLRLPALRHRREDIAALFDFFSAVKRTQLTAGFVERLLVHDWPGNIRELQNAAAALKVREPNVAAWTTASFHAVTSSSTPPLEIDDATRPTDALRDRGIELSSLAPERRADRPISRTPATSVPMSALGRADWIELYNRHGRVAAKVAEATGYSASSVKRHLAKFGITQS